ncbi:hypothetical protein HY496_00665, partial [Candidatus Woesearchaeota archaeon]|nr:hypothetical protein [Candidatus Woesearchaeota archaeon]
MGNKRNGMFVSLVLLVVALFVVSCSPQLDPEGNPLPKEALAGQAVYVKLSYAQLGQGITLHEGYNKFTLGTDGGPVKATDFFKSIESDLNMVFTPQKEAYVPGKTAVTNPYIKTYPTWLETISPGKTYLVYIKQDSLPAVKTVLLKYPASAAGSSPQQAGVLCDDPDKTYNTYGTAPGAILNWGSFDQKTVVSEIDAQTKKVLKQSPLDYCEGTKFVHEYNCVTASSFGELKQACPEGKGCKDGACTTCTPGLVNETKCVKSKYGATFAVQGQQAANCSVTFNEKPDWGQKGVTWCAVSCVDGKGCCTITLKQSWCEGSTLYNTTVNSCTGEVSQPKASDCSLASTWSNVKSPKTCGVKNNVAGCYEACTPGELIVKCGSSSWNYGNYTCDASGFGFNYGS